jgi:HSP20 family protein
LICIKSHRLEILPFIHRFITVRQRVLPARIVKLIDVEVAMNLEKLKPWNWFKHEENESRAVPVTRQENQPAADSLLNLQREMDRWFENLSSAFGLPAVSRNLLDGGGRRTATLANLYRPQIDVSGDDNGYEIKLDVPGLTEADLSIEVRDDVLIIRGEQQQQSEDKGKQYYRVERSYGAFQRTLSLPDDADADEIEAKIDNGVLRLGIPRRQSVNANVKRIPISS